MTYEVLLPAIVRAAQRVPTAAGLASLRAALSGRPAPQRQPEAWRPFDAAGDQEFLRDDAGDRVPLAVAAPAPPPDPHDQPDPAFDWMFRTRS